MGAYYPDDSEFPTKPKKMGGNNTDGEIFDFENEYPSEFKEDCKNLLRKCLTIFNDLPDTPIKGGRGLTTYKLASEIRELLKH